MQNSDEHAARNVETIQMCPVVMCSDMFAHLKIWGSRGSVVDIATGYGLDD
jgi:hypothetical protein